jgi:uncharacterized membrane protein
MISYFSCFSFLIDLKQYSKYTEQYVQSSLANISRPMTKAIILINRWASIPCKIYTNHAGFVKWMLEIQQGCIFQEVQTAMVAAFKN